MSDADTAPTPKGAEGVGNFDRWAAIRSYLQQRSEGRYLEAFHVSTAESAWLISRLQRADDADASDEMHKRLGWITVHPDAMRAETAAAFKRGAEKMRSAVINFMTLGKLPEDKP